MFNNHGFENLGMGFNPQLNNFNNAYKSHTIEIPQRDFTNHNEVIHNNIEPELVNEILTEYIIHIDGADRDKNIFPNPFRYTVTLGGTGINTNQNGEIVSGSPDPRIDRSYKNIKQIKIKYIILPKYYKFLYQKIADYETYTPNIDGTFLRNFRYLILKIKELDSDKINSTNSVCKPNTFVLYKNLILYIFNGN